MQIKVHPQNDTIAEIILDDLLFENAEDGIDVFGTLFFDGFNKIIVHKNNLPKLFFDLSSGMAGEILQKFSTYQIKLAIIGDFSILKSESLKAFISESNKMGNVIFSNSINEVVEFWSND